MSLIAQTASSAQMGAIAPIGEAQTGKVSKQEEIYRFTVAAKNQFTAAFSACWSDAEIRVLAQLKRQFR